MNAPLKHSTIDGMRSDYSRNALAQANAIAFGLEKAAIHLISPLAKGTTDASKLHFLDLGAADGVNSFSIVSRFAEEFCSAAEGVDCDLLVSHLDLPEADLNALAQNLSTHPAGYRQHLMRGAKLCVNSAILPASFYNRYLPSESADLIFATVSLHYASRLAGPISNHIDPLYTTGEERKTWRRQSVDDLDTIMRRAHSALKPGGKFWAIAPAHVCGDNGDVANHWYRELWLVVMDELTTLQKTGVLKTNCFENCIIPAHQRGESEWTNWFEQNPSLFALEYVELVEQENPYLTRYRDVHHDPVTFADEYLASVRAWSDHLFSNLIPDPDARAQFFAGLHVAFRQNPERFTNDAVNAYVGATRL